MPISLKNIKSKDWVKVWSGRWSFNSDINFGYHWTIMNKVAGKPAYNQIIYVYKNGITDCWVSVAGKDDLGKRLIKVYKDSQSVKKLSAALKGKAQEVFSFIKSHNPQAISLKDYQKFWQLAGEYYLPHLSVKYIVDYFSEAQLKKFLPILEEARLFSEPVFREIENFMEKIAAGIARQSKYNREQILSTTAAELIKHFHGVKLPEKRLLTARYAKSAILVDRGEYKTYIGKEVNKIEDILSPQKGAKIIKGSIAYKGISTGLVRLVIDPKKDGAAFRQGEILVTGMTRPEFLSVIKKAAAFITDAGGILSHAAIIARELKKPCVIGTHVATRLLKNGDLVEVDANKGIIRILK